MKTNIDFEVINELIKLIIPVISLILTAFVVPWIKSKISTEKLSELQKYTEIAVRCAEQIYTPEEWKEKKIYVMNYITQKVNEIGIEATQEDINLMVEGIVNLVKKNKE